MKLKAVKTTLLFLSVLSVNAYAINDVSIENQAEIAKVTEEGKNSIYPASFFSQYSAQNAKEMIDRLPGFTFQSGSDARGFGGNAGNVLINGARPTSKSVSLSETLTRIPESQVLHIEILRGGVGSSEASGQSIVANVVKKQPKTSGTWTTNAIRLANGAFAPDFIGSISFQVGEWQAALDGTINGDPEYRKGNISEYNANNELTETADEKLEALEYAYDVNGEASRSLAGGTFTANIALSHIDYDEELSLNKRILNTNVSESKLIKEVETIDKGELGLDWVKSFTQWKMRMIALTSHERSKLDEEKFEQVGSLANTQTAQYNKETTATEHIARFTLSELTDNALSTEFGVEIANNRLESDAILAKTSTEQTIESVEELRAELFATISYQYSPRLTLEGGLTGEISTITAKSSNGTDVIEKTQDLQFLKPRLSANYQINAQSNLTLVAEHTVEQLDFSDFTASIDSEEDRATSGNTNLQPEKVTGISATYDWRFSERGSFQSTFYYEHRKDIHEYIILPSGNSGLGNAGDAKFWGLKTTINLPIDAIIDQGLLTFYHSHKGSRFKDPIINDHRVIYDYEPNYVSIDFRHDVAAYDFSWGWEYEHEYKRKRYYVNEIQTNEGNSSLTRLYFETMKFWDMKSQLVFKNINVIRDDRHRDIFDGDRSGDFQSREITNRKTQPSIVVIFSGTF